MGEGSEVISRPMPVLDKGDVVTISDYSLYAGDELTEKGDPEVLDDFNPESVDEKPWNDQLDESYDLEFEYCGRREPYDHPDPIIARDQEQSFHNYFESMDLVKESLETAGEDLKVWRDSRVPDIPVYVGTSWREKALTDKDPWLALDKHGVFGGVDPIYFGGKDPISDHDEAYFPTYFSGDAQMALAHPENTHKGLIELSLQDIAQEREIFIDPEGMHLPEEIGKSFVVMGGIPGDCIERIHHFKRTFTE